MLGTIFALLGLGVYGTYAAGDVASDNYTAEQKSKRNGLPYYVDNKGKFRTVGTGRLCTWGLENGNRVLRECSADGKGGIVFDNTEEILRQKNKNAEEQGKKYYWVRVPGTANMVQFDKETHRAYKFGGLSGKGYIRYAAGDEWKQNRFRGEIRVFENWEDGSRYF